MPPLPEVYVEKMGYDMSMDVCVYGCIRLWMDGTMDEWTDRWTDS